MFLVDIFEFVSNLTLQGKGVNVLQCHKKLTVFNMQLKLWHSKLNKKNFAPFPHLNEFLDEIDLQINNDIIEVMKCRVSIFNEEISHYFPNLQEFDKLYRFINTPFRSSRTIYHQQAIKFKSSLLIWLMMELQKMFTGKCVAVTSE